MIFLLRHTRHTALIIAVRIVAVKYFVAALREKKSILRMNCLLKPTLPQCRCKRREPPCADLWGFQRQVRGNTPTEAKYEPFGAGLGKVVQASESAPFHQIPQGRKSSR